MKPNEEIYPTPTPKIIGEKENKKSLKIFNLLLHNGYMTIHLASVLFWICFIEICKTLNSFKTCTEIIK